MKSKKLVSVVIRTLNEERYLEELLSAIGNQFSSKYKIETVIVDSGSSDRTLQIAEEFGCRITHIHKDDFTFGRSLNVGCDFADGDFLVFVSGHCIPTGSDWVDKLVAPLELEGIEYSYGRQIGRDTTKYSEEQLLKKYFPEKSKVPQKGFFCNNANSAVTKSAWSEYQFDEHLTGLEDMDLAKRLTRSGCMIAYVAEAPVFHIHDESWKQVRRRYEREAIALQDIMPELHFNRIDFITCVIQSIISDCVAAKSDRVLVRSLKDIVMFRTMQYWGAYRGNHEHRYLSKQMKYKYFYPNTDIGVPHE